MTSRLTVAGAALAMSLCLPLGAQAQQSQLPSYATGEESIHGTVTGFDGKYAMTIRDARGYTDNVHLHDGTIINPTGLRLEGGMTVTIFGRPAGSHFNATEIDTPYHLSYGYPYPAYPYYGGPYGYYGGGPFFGPAFGVGFHFR